MCLNEKYAGDILMFDIPRIPLVSALKRLGYSYNTTRRRSDRRRCGSVDCAEAPLQAYVMDDIFESLRARTCPSASITTGLSTP